MPPATTHLKIFRPWANKNCFMSVKKNWCPKLNTINHVHSRLPEYIWSPMKGVWNSSHSKFCRSTSCYLVKHNLVMAPKAILTQLPADNTSLKAVGVSSPWIRVVLPRESFFPYSCLPRVVLPSFINSASKNEIWKIPLQIFVVWML